MNHPQRAASFIADRNRAAWHDQALWFVREKRDRMAHSLGEWETLREKAAAIKTATIAQLPELLVRFETNALQQGIQIHWASTPEQHNRIVHSLLQERGVKRVVKSKSMLTEECHLNEYLMSQGIDVIDTDLGERIVQLRREVPSHIVMPAIHIRKQEVGELFHEHFDTPAGQDDPKILADAARGHLREAFLQAEAGITGVNFAIAETGGFVVCTNEGNADLGTCLPPLHIACMGIEKLIPRLADLGVFLRLLARSATGQPITTYSSHFHGPVQGGELHVVLLDNGRSRIAGDAKFQRSLNCIRCGACMNTCPVYRRTGGHSYGTTVPGPIGSILAPAQDAKLHASLPHACTLCGSCTDVCPVKIDLHHQLLAWRKVLVQRNLIGWRKRNGARLAAMILRRPWLYRIFGRMTRLTLRWAPRWLLYRRWNPWGQNREMPLPPKQSFRSWYRDTKASREEHRQNPSDSDRETGSPS